MRNSFLDYTKKYNFLFTLVPNYFSDFMVMANAQVKKWGNSLGVIIPSKTVKQLKLREGKIIQIEVKVKEKINGFGIFKGAKPFKEEEEPHKELWGMK